MTTPMHPRKALLDRILCLAVACALATTLSSASAQDPIDPPGFTPLTDPAAEAKIGGVRVIPGISPLGLTEIAVPRFLVSPFQTDDCDADGNLDLVIASSGGPTPVTLDFSEAIPDGTLPTEVTISVLGESAAVQALDSSGNELDSATTTLLGGVQDLTLSHASGIHTVALEGTQICLVELCFSQVSGIETPFVRGDADGNGQLDLADPIRILDYIFNGATIDCASAADANDAQGLNIGDAIFLLGVLFSSGVAMPAPYPDCGADPTEDSLECGSYSACSGATDQSWCFDSVELGETEYAIPLRSGVLAPGVGLDIEGIEETAVDDRVHFFVQVETVPASQDEFESLGVELLDYVGGGAYVAAMDTSELGIIDELPDVRWAGPISPLVKVELELQAGDLSVQVPWAISPDGQLGVDVYFHADTPEDAGSEVIVDLGGDILAEIASLHMVQAVIDPDLLWQLASNDCIRFIETVSMPLSETNNVARQESNVEPLRMFPYDLTGTGVTVAIYDTGNIDSNHPDFDGNRVIEIESPLEGSSEHATHVAGTVGGSGVHSPSIGGTPGQFAGMAPGVHLRSFGLGLHFSHLYGNPSDLLSNIRGSSPTDLVNMSLGHNVVLNGFPCRELGDYTTTSKVIDSIVLGEPAATGVGSEPAIPFIQAVGNERQGGAPCGNLMTVGSPATAKNSITVGALVPGTNDLFSFSSYGPTDDGRIRPDLVATGQVNSTILDHGYDIKMGTSMASPVVAGVAALLIEEWRWLRHVDEFESEPFPPHMIKAILIHTANDIGPVGPDYFSGWGRVDAKEAVDLIRADHVASEAGNPLIYTGSAGSGAPYQIEFMSDGSVDQKFTLVWDDALPSVLTGQVLVNDLDLRVTDPTGTTRFPLRPDPTAANLVATEGVDRWNNVEMVVAGAMAGLWFIEVVGTRIPNGGTQPFTLVRQPSVGIAPCDQVIQKTVEFTPPWVGGDRDYFGHGPHFDTLASLEVREGNELWLKLDVAANEGESDWTSAAGIQEHLVYYDPMVSNVTLLTDPETSANFEATGPGPFADDLGTSSLVRSLTYFGDIDGGEAGDYTRVRMVTNPIEISCVPASTPSPKQIVQVPPMYILPVHVAPGDEDFDGNGPDVDLSVTITIGGASDTEIYATVFMDAVEVGGDGTRVFAAETHLVYTHSTPIAAIVSDDQSTASYTDQDWLDDRPIPVGSLVREFKVVGDTDGSEAGTRTAVTIDFNPIIFLEE